MLISASKQHFLCQRCCCVSQCPQLPSGHWRRSASSNFVSMCSVFIFCLGKFELVEPSQVHLSLRDLHPCCLGCLLRTLSHQSYPYYIYIFSLRRQVWFCSVRKVIYGLYPKSRGRLPDASCMSAIFCNIKCRLLDL